MASAERAHPQSLTYEELGRLVGDQVSGFIDDGIRSLRAAVDEPERWCAWGEVYEISQMHHVFCIDFVAAASAKDEPRWAWTLHFEPLRRTGATRDFTARDLRNLPLLFVEPGSCEWEHVRTGVWP